MRSTSRNADLYHAALTDSGIAKVTNGIKQLNPNADYQIREDGDAGWIPLGRGEHAQPYRHDWIVVPRKRPIVPVLYGAQGSHTEDEQANAAPGPLSFRGSTMCAMLLIMFLSLAACGILA